MSSVNKKVTLDPKTKMIVIVLTHVLILYTLVISVSSFELIGEAQAASLTGVSVVPTSNTINERSTFDFIFTTKTTGTIKTISIAFPSNFNIGIAKLIETSGIGKGSLSSQGQSLIYTIDSPTSVPSGKTIRLQAGKIIGVDEGLDFRVSIKTLNPQGGTIDGPTASGVFTIESIRSDDISPSFMVRKTLDDDDAGHTHGWNPDDVKNIFNNIIDEDIAAANLDDILIDANVVGGGACDVQNIKVDAPGTFSLFCPRPPADNSELHYVITQLPGNRVTSLYDPESLSATSNPFESLANTG